MGKGKDKDAERKDAIRRVVDKNVKKVGGKKTGPDTYDMTEAVEELKDKTNGD